MVEPDYEKLYKLQSEEITTLNRQLAQVQEQLTAALSGNAELLAQLKVLQEKLDRLLAQKKNRDRKEFDSKSERHNPRPASQSTARTQPAGQHASDKSAEKSRKNSFVDSPDLEPEIVPHPVAEDKRICPHCQVETVFVSEKVTHQLERLVHSLKLLEHRQEVRSCPKCKAYMTTGTKPTSPIPGSYAGPGLLAHMVVNKVEDGLPNYRQEKMLAREQIPFPRSTQCDWFIALSLLVTPLYDLLNLELLASKIIQTDESPIKVLDRGLKKNIRKAKLTGYRGDLDHKLVSFDFSPDLCFERNRRFLKDFAGIVQADAAGGFDALFKDNNQRLEAGCHAHARRRIFDAKDTSPEVAGQMLDIYTRLYEIEDKARCQPPAIRLAMRRKYSKPLIKQLRGMQKNSLFVGSDAGGRALAIHRSLVASAKRNGLNPVEYLTDVFGRINDMKTSELHQLLPTRWAEFKKPDSDKIQRFQKTGPP